MILNTPYQLLALWKQKNQWISILSVLFAFIIIYILFKFDILQLPISIAASLASILSIYLLQNNRQPNLNNAIDLAHQQNPNLQYSAQLLVRDSSLEGLALLQKKKAEELFGSVTYQIPWDYNTVIKTAILISSITIGAVSVQQLIGTKISDKSITNHQGVFLSQDTVEHAVLDSTYIKSLSIIEIPPNYTGLPQKTHINSNLQVLEGSTVQWKTHLSGTVDKLYFLFSKGDTIDITKTAIINKTFYDADFYQYGFRDRSSSYASDFFSLKVIKDQKPQVLITGVDEYVRLPWKANHTISFNVSISDDYGHNSAFISATIAKGSGEAVKFRERKFELKNYTSGSRPYQGMYSFSTAELGMEPGDELYFYVKAKDNYPSAEALD